MILFLIIAVLTDFKYDRIYNGWIFSGILSGLFFRIQESGWYGAGGALISMLIPFALLYPLYKIGALGAGDIKLLIMSGSFFKAEESVYIIIFSFTIAAILSLIKMTVKRNLKERMQYLLSYLFGTLTTRQWKMYEESPEADARTYKSNKIHFALPVFISVMLRLGGLF